MSTALSEKAIRWAPKAKQARADSIANGVCVRYGCTNLPQAGSLQCSAHLEQNRQRYGSSTPEHKQKGIERRHRDRHHEPYENKLKRLEQQGYRCANPGCRTTEPGKHGWHTDHNHETGVIRGELCNGCNTALGMLYENPKIISGLIDYLQV